MRGSVLAVLAACGAPQAAPPPPAPSPGPVATAPAAPPVDAPGPSDDERMAAIQKAINELAPASQQCWALAAAERFDIEGMLKAQIEIGATSYASIVSDTTHDEPLARCMTELLAGWKWAPPLYGQTIQLPFEFHAPAGQSVIDRRLVPWKGQGKVSMAVLLDEHNTGNPGASMLEVALAAGGSTGLRWVDRAEVWYFLGAAEVKSPALGTKQVAAGDMMFAPKGSVREVAAAGADVHAVVVFVPGGPESTERAGALPNRDATGTRKAPAPVVLPAAAARAYGPATIYAEDATIHDKTLAASVLALPAGARVPEHVHAGETELLYVLAGAGTMTVAGTDVAVTPTSVVQIPPNTKHAFVATDPVRAVQVYSPAGPEQRFKKK